MKKLFSILAVVTCLAVTLPAQVPISRLPDTNVTAQLQDEIILNHWLTSTQFVTVRSYLTNLARLILQSEFTNSTHFSMVNSNSPGVPLVKTISAGAGISITNQVTNEVIAATGGGGSGIATLDGSGTNTSIYGSTATKVPLKIFAGSTNAIELYDVSGNLVAWGTTNGYWRGTNDFVATLQTTDNTTNNIFTFTPRQNSAVRVLATFVGYNSTNSAAYVKHATFRNNAGSVSQVGSTATVGSAEDDTNFESIVDVSGTTVRCRVAGDTGRTVNWTVYVTLYYAE